MGYNQSEAELGERPLSPPSKQLPSDAQPLDDRADEADELRRLPERRWQGRFVDEQVVSTPASRDATAAIARQHGARFHTNPLPGDRPARNLPWVVNGDWCWCSATSSFLPKPWEPLRQLWRTAYLCWTTFAFDGRQAVAYPR